MGRAVAEGMLCPRINDKEQLIVAHRMMWWLAFGKICGKIGVVVRAVGVVGVAVWMGWGPEMKGLLGR